MQGYKSIFPIMLMMVVVSCQPQTPEYQEAILQFLDETEGERYNLDFQIESCEYLGQITARDSVDFLRSSLKVQRNQGIEMFRDSIAITLREVERLQEAMKFTENPEWITELEKQIEGLHAEVIIFQAILNHYQAGYQHTPLEKDHTRLANYEQQPERVLAHRYRCSVTMQNTALSSSKQNKSQEFVLDAEQLRVIAP